MQWHNNEPLHGSIIHADHGTQFTSWASTSNVDKHGLRLSLGTVGDCYDNAMIGTFWARTQTELLTGRKWTTIVELSTEMVVYIDTFHNHQRRHSSLHRLTPTEYENLYAPTFQLTSAREKTGIPSSQPNTRGRSAPRIDYRLSVELQHPKREIS